MSLRAVREWAFRVHEATDQRPSGVAVRGIESGDLIVNWDEAELRGRSVSPAISVYRMGPDSLSLSGVTAAELAAGDVIVGGGSSVPQGAKRWGQDPDDLDEILADDDLLFEWSWDVAVYHGSGLGSSGHWTVGFWYLPMSVGGHKSEEAAVEDLRRKHRAALADEEYRAKAVRVVRRSQGLEPIEPGLLD